MSFKIEASCGCFIGTERDNNEDNFFFNQKHLSKINRGLNEPVYYNCSSENAQVFAVFDGIGGEAAGETAAYIASEVFADEAHKLDSLLITGKEFFTNVCFKINSAICDYSSRHQCIKTGSTIAAFFVFQNEIFSCNIGDSKIFRIRCDKLMQISKDHTDEQILKDMCISKKPSLLQYLGISENEMQIEPFITRGEMQSGDIYIACSDGITDSINVQELYDICSKENSSFNITDKIIDCAKRAGACDNSTLVTLKII